MCEYEGIFADVVVHARDGNVKTFNNVLDISLDNDCRVISYMDSNGEMHIANRDILWNLDIKSITINIHKEA